MLFNSHTFVVFLLVALTIYWAIGVSRVRAQNAFLLAASYVFYGWWDWRFLGLIALSSLVDFFVARRLAAQEDDRRRRMLLGVSLFVNVGMLGFFKYFNFFAASLTAVLGALGVSVTAWTLKVVLPVGISFYTFQTLSYTIDVYRRELEPVDDLISFLAYVSFFPQLVAGPIERAVNLLPQFLKPRSVTLDDIEDGLLQMLWGLFKKVVVADNCAVFANRAFENYHSLPGSAVALGVLYFAFQIYGDFSGYSDMARGCARLFGFRLMVNFRCPYFSRDIAEFWRRWHISLSTWFRDYVYIPLGGSRGNQVERFRNVLAIFLLSGLWHGANWTFVAWGAVHSILFMPLMFSDRNRKNLGEIAENEWLPSFSECFEMAFCFVQVCFAWIFFRARSLTEAWAVIRVILSGSLVEYPQGWLKFLPLIGLMVGIEWIRRGQEHPLRSDDFFGHWVMVALVAWAVLLWGAYGEAQFIYFQF